MSDLDDLEDFEDFIEYTRRVQAKQGLKRYLRDYDDPFTKYSSEDFFSRYRFTPHVVKNVLVPIIEPDLRKPTKRGLPFSPEIMMLITLRYYATGSSKKFEQDTMEVCQQSASRIIARISMLLAQKMGGVVKFPATPEGILLIKQKFYKIAEFPDVLGCLNSTHVKIKSPGGNSAEQYKNRKGWYSMKVQAVAGPDLQFYHINARWPGRTEDSLIFNSSVLKQTLESGKLDGVLLGGSSYGVSPGLMTPFLSPENAAQERYNKSHKKTQNVVNQAVEIWKRRFPCLQSGMALKLETVMAVICACAMLHNVAIRSNDILEPAFDHNGNEDDVQVTEDPGGSGFKARDELVRKYFLK